MHSTTVEDRVIHCMEMISDYFCAPDVHIEDVRSKKVISEALLTYLNIVKMQQSGVEFYVRYPDGRSIERVTNLLDRTYADESLLAAEKDPAQDPDFSWADLLAASRQDMEPHRRKRRKHEA